MGKDNKDPWMEMESEVDKIVTDVVAQRDNFQRASALLDRSGDEDKLIAAVQAAQEYIDDMRLAVDMAMNHPERFPLEAAEIQRRRDLIRQWERKMERASNDCGSILAERGKKSADRRRSSGPGVVGGGPENQNNEFLGNEVQLQYEIEKEQDEVVDRIAVGVQSVKVKAEMINNELKEQDEILAEMDTDMSALQLKLEGVVKKVGRLLDDTSDRNKIICIIVLVVVLVLLVAFTLSGEQ